MTRDPGWLGAFDPHLNAAVERFEARNPEDDLTAQIDQWRHHRDEASLRDAFGARLRFGTSGVRGPVAPGWNRVNAVTLHDLVVAALTLVKPTEAAPSVLVAYDGRARSRRYAGFLARVIRTFGYRVWGFDRPTPTPLAVVATQHFQAVYGFVVTASHNPKDHHGLKVYGRDGRSLDSDLATQVEEHRNATEQPTLRVVWDEPNGVPAWERVDDETLSHYLEILRSFGLESRETDRRSLTVGYSALHGVGALTSAAVFDAFGFTEVRPVSEQMAPDPEFPTLRSLNPEDQGALEALRRLGEETRCDVAIAHDPDADRLAVLASERLGGPLVQLSGDQIGCLLAEARLSRSGPSTMMATTMVSSRRLAAMARQSGAHYRETPTGFKWLMPAWLDELPADTVPGIAYEQALGFAVDARITDKDGISAMLAILDLAARLKAQGATLWNAVARLDRTYGTSWTDDATYAFVNRRWSEQDPQQLVPVTLAGVERSAFWDFGQGSVSDYPFPTWPAMLPPQALLVATYANGCRLCVRPSGTEPVLKCYFEHFGHPMTSAAEERRIDGAAMLKRFVGAHRGMMCDLGFRVQDEGEI